MSASQQSNPPTIAQTPAFDQAAQDYAEHAMRAEDLALALEKVVEAYLGAAPVSVALEEAEKEPQDNSLLSRMKLNSGRVQRALGRLSEEVDRLQRGYPSHE